MKVAEGKRYRITETYPSGTVQVVTGVVTRLSRGGDVATFGRDDASTWVADNLDSIRGMTTVIVEPLSDPLPTTPGSLIRWYNGINDENDLLMRMECGSPNPWQTSGGIWYDDPAQAEQWDVIFDAGAET